MAINSMELGESANLLFEEFKYRHEFYWKMHGKFFIALITIFSLKFIYSISIDLQQLKIAPANVSILLAIGLIVIGLVASITLANEYYRLMCIGQVYTRIKADNNLYYNITDLSISWIEKWFVKQSSWFYRIVNLVPFALSIILAVLLLINR